MPDLPGPRFRGSALGAGIDVLRSPAAHLGPDSIESRRTFVRQTARALRARIALVLAEGQ